MSLNNGKIGTMSMYETMGNTAARNREPIPFQKIVPTPPPPEPMKSGLVTHVLPVK